DMINKLEVLNTIAGNNGHKDWLELTHCEGPITILNCTIEAMELYAEQSNSHKHSVMQAEGSDGVAGAAVGQRSVGTNAEAVAFNCVSSESLIYNRPCKEWC